MEILYTRKFDLSYFKLGHFIVFQRKGYLGDKIYEEQLQEGFEDWQAEYAHVAVSGGGPYIIEATWPRSRTVNMVEKHKGRQIKVVTFKWPEYETRHRKHVAFWAAAQNNLRYGAVSLLFWKLKDIVPLSNNFLAKKKAPFCSMLALSALYRQIPKAQEKIIVDPEESMPAHFLTDSFQIIGEWVIP